MSAPGSARQAVALLSGRWQIPVALAAVVTSTVTLIRLMPRRTVDEFGSLLADVTALQEAGAATAAADALANLLEMEPPLPDAQRAEVHDRLADLIDRQEQLRGVPNLHNVRLALEHHDAADRLRYPHSAHRSLRAARAAEWLGDSTRAIPAYRDALALHPSAEQRRQAMQGLVRLLANRPDATAERQRLLEDLLADESLSAGYLWWALQQALQLALDESDTVRARLLLARHADRLRSSDLKGYSDYLWAWVMVHEGRPEEAEPLVQWIDDWLEQRVATDQELDDFGHLPAMNRWLLGRVHLAEHRPQAALAAFEEALALRPDRDLFLGVTAGRAQALANLSRHKAAQQTFRAAVARLAAMPGPQKPGVERLRQNLLELFERINAEQDYANALDYLLLAAELTPAEQLAERLDLLEKIGKTCHEAARATDAADLRRHYAAQAGQYLEEATELSQSDESRLASLLWSSAQGYDQAGRIADVRRVLQRFLAGRPSDPRLPRALLQLGQAFEADGHLEEALQWYARLPQQFPKLEEAYRAQLFRAGCLLALGREPDAERVLHELLEDDNIAPQAVIFHDALLELCDLLYQSGRFAEAISRLESFITLYPDDPERYRGRFMLADAYRRSGYALREDPPPNAGHDELQAASSARFRRAAELFEALLADLADEPQPDQVLDLYDRLSLFYRADCLFELNQPESMAEALETYRRAAARYERQPPALTAQVQIANIHLRLGRLAEAARAVQRARWLLQNIPADAFAACPDGASREHWQRYLTTVASSDLFQDVFASNP